MLIHRLALDFIKYYPFDHSKNKTIIGLAAGFDKNCDVVSHIHKFGFAFAEVGSLTPKENRGNISKIIKFDHSLINNLGLPNIGIDKAIPKLQKAKPRIPILVNISPLHDSTFRDMQNTVSKIDIPCISAIVLNLSCPNIECDTNLDLIKLKSSKPIYMKLSPNLSYKELVEIVELSIDNKIKGYVLTNSMPVPNGGLSGRNLREFSNGTIRAVNKLKEENQIIIGCGGIEKTEDIVEKRNIGANYVELLTSWILSKNPLYIHNLNINLNALNSKLNALGINNHILNQFNQNEYIKSNK